MSLCTKECDGPIRDNLNMNEQESNKRDFGAPLTAKKSRPSRDTEASNKRALEYLFENRLGYPKNMGYDMKKFLLLPYAHLFSAEIYQSESDNVAPIWPNTAHLYEQSEGLLPMELLIKMLKLKPDERCNMEHLRSSPWINGTWSGEQAGMEVMKVLNRESSISARKDAYDLSSSTGDCSHPVASISFPPPAPPPPRTPSIPYPSPTSLTQAFSNSAEKSWMALVAKNLQPSSSVSNSAGPVEHSGKRTASQINT